MGLKAWFDLRLYLNYDKEQEGSNVGFEGQKTGHTDRNDLRQ